MPAWAHMLEHLEQPSQTDHQPNHAPPVLGIAQAEERPDRHKSGKPLPVRRCCGYWSEFNRGQREDGNGQDKQPSQPLGEESEGHDQRY